MSRTLPRATRRIIVGGCCPWKGRCSPRSRDRAGWPGRCGEGSGLAGPFRRGRGGYCAGQVVGIAPGQPAWLAGWGCCPACVSRPRAWPPATLC